jgi:hypothetical protein
MQARKSKLFLRGDKILTPQKLDCRQSSRRAHDPPVFGLFAHGLEDFFRQGTLV